jgi:Zn-dependent peptidase ImmA (M78 family)/transcriptional regulator with XRE-family HTH domain
MPNVTQANGRVLRWAREQAGLSEEEAAARAHINPTKSIEAGERVRAFEEGTAAPTAAQLKALAGLYRRPILTFYLRNPPVSDQPLPDFRTVGDALLREPSANLEVLIRRFRARQQQVREFLIEAGAKPLSMVGKFVQRPPVTALVADMRRETKFTLETQMRLQDRDTLFRALRESFEHTGIFVQLAGDLGSHHTAIAPEEFRGLALLDNIAPFVVINANDAQAAFAVTLVHEVAHLWIGVPGISNFSPFQPARRDAVETYCNAVASEFLLPEDQFVAGWRTEQQKQSLPATVLTMANSWKVSRVMVANRLWTLGLIPDDDWWTLYRMYQEEWRARRQHLRDQEGGPGYFILTRRRLGRSLIRAVFRALDAGIVTYTQASRILNVKTKYFTRLRQETG